MKVTCGITETEPCSYLRNCFSRQAQMRPTDRGKMHPSFYTLDTLRETRFHLLERGFVSAGPYPQASQCGRCNSCVPLRINSEKFEPSRSQLKLFLDRRKRFSTDIEGTHTDCQTTKEHYDLFMRYLAARHKDSGMRGIQEDDFRTSTRFMSHRLIVRDTEADDKMVAFATLDVHGHQACFQYLSYDPDYLKMSLGKFSWLTLIDHCISNDIDHMYIGSWVAGGTNMDYKRQYGGLETIVNGQWVDFDPEIHVQGPDFGWLQDRHIYDFS